MSSDEDAAAATVSIVSILSTSGYCNVAAAVLFIYDTFITFDREVAYFWTSKRIGGASPLFFANKWISIAVHVMTLVAFASFPSEKSCSVFAIAVKAMGILQFVPGAAFSALRAYVLSGRSRFLGILVATLSLAPVGANLVFYGYQLTGENFPPLGCLEIDNTTAALDFRLVVISRVPLIASDIILIYITWKTLRGSAALKDMRPFKRLTLLDVLFRGGTIYFVILFVLNVLHLTFSATAVASDGENSYVTVFTAPITAILISRFLLALQGTNHMVVKLDANDPLYFSRNAWDSTPSFISPIGGFINPELAACSLHDEDGLELQDRPPSETPEVAEGAHTEVPDTAASSSESSTP